VKGNKEAYPRGGDCRCKDPVEGVRGRRRRGQQEVGLAQQRLYIGSGFCGS